MTHKVLILANVGNRDVMHDGRFLSSPREDGARLHERYRQESSKIVLPIISPAFEYISDDWEREVSDPAVAGLFCTDQEDPRFRKSDTVEVARVVRRKILDGFQKPSEGLPPRLHFGGGKAVQTYPVEGTPARYDDMYGFYERFFASNSRFREPEGWLCFVLTSGGTPAMNSMLIFHAVRHFGENCVQIYVSPDGVASDMQVGEEMVRAAVERRFNETLDVLQFRAAAEVLERASRGGHRSAACRYAEHRLAFDFRQARKRCLEASRGAEGDVKRYLDGHARTTQSLERGASNQALLIEELFYNLAVKYAAGEFVDMLGRAFRLQEALLTWTVERNTEIRTGKRKKLSDQEEAVDSVPGLRASLESYRTAKDKIKLEMRREINRVALMAITEHLATPDAQLPEEARMRAEKVAGAAEKIEALADLRNRTIIAHGFEGVSGEDIPGSETLVKDLRSMVGAALDRDLSTSPFFDLAEKLRF